MTEEELREPREPAFDPSRDAAHDPGPSTPAPGLRLRDFGGGTPLTLEPAWAEWIRELSTLGGRTPLLHFVDAPSTRLELGTTHPGGLAQFITGKKTLLSSLIRDDLALRSARAAAAEITAKGIELATARGIDAVHLAIGLAEWKHDARDYRAPVLLQPLALRRYGRDYELRLKGEAVLNPALQRALAEQFQIELDAQSFANLALAQGSFKPQPVIDRLRGLTSHLSWFSVQPRLVVSCFAEISPQLAKDAQIVDHPVLAALAGDAAARDLLAESHKPAEIISSDSRQPATDTLLLDADGEQEQIVAEIAAGNSATVHTMPGSGGTQTIVNALGALVAQRKRVLVVSPRRASLRAIESRLQGLGLDGLAVSPASLKRDVIKAIMRNEQAQRPAVSEVDEALVRLRGVLLDYRAALIRPHDDLGISMLDALNELSRLALLPDPPSTTARLSRASVRQLAAGRADAARVLVQAAQLGEFRYGPGDSPWYGVDFQRAEDAAAAHDVARLLHSDLIPELLDRVQQSISGLPVRQPQTVAELGAVVELLLDIRETLDQFVPEVYERSLSELIVATGPRRESRMMSSGDRRRLVKLAKEYLRPGSHVGDLNDALVKIQHQRTLWQRLVVGGVEPSVPIGLTELQRVQRRVLDTLDTLDMPLNPDGKQTPLRDLPFASLRQRIEALAADSDALDNLHERTDLLATLRTLDLTPLLRDLAERHVPESRVALELELAWWQSVLEQLLQDDRALLNANTEVLSRLEADYRLVDEAHAGANASLLAWQLAQTWKIGIVDFADDASSLKGLLKSGYPVTPRSLQEAAPQLGRGIAPVWLCSPYEVAQLPAHVPFDAVLLVDAGAVTVAEAVPALRRARQVVAFGDPVTQHPSAFRLGLVEPMTEERADTAAPPQSAFEALAPLVPGFALTRSYRSGGQDLSDLNSRRFYEGRIDSLPWAGQYLGHSSITVERIERGSGMPDPVTGTVESVDAEVERAVALVIQHAEQSPQQSLMVLTASAKHAVRVEQAVLAAFARRPELSEFLLAERAEPFMVATLEQSVAQSRDRVIFSIGFGQTPHGRLLSQFGALGEPGGERALAHAMTRARRSMVILSCFGPDDIDEGRMKHGALLLAQVLREAGALQPEQPLIDDSQPMLVDLSQRLLRRGLRVSLGYRERLGLVASFGGRAAVIDTDAVLGAGTLRETLRLRPHTLHRLGWHYLRVHSFELFVDPEAVADRIARTLGALAETSVGLPTQPIDLPRAQAS